MFASLEIEDRILFCLDLNVDILLIEILGFFLFVIRCLLLRLFRRLVVFDLLLRVFI